MRTTGGAQTESFAAYLAKALIARKGYRPGTVPEAQELLDHGDAVLTRADGLTLEIVVIVDRERDPDRRFGLTKEALDRIGEACLRYTGRAWYRRLPVFIVIIETDRTPVSEDIKERLRPLKSRFFFPRVLIAAFALDVSSRTIWSSAARRALAMRFFLRDLMSKPRLPETELMPKPPAAPPERRPLVLTYGLLAILLAVFAAEYVFPVSPGNGLNPSIRTLVALGALDKGLVIEGGQWWRLFAAPLLHGGPVHIAFNGIALFFAGTVLENVIGRVWFAAVFVVSGVAGALMSLFINPPTLISVGASGAIMGLFAAAFAVSYRYSAGSPMRSFLQSGSLRVLIPSMIPLFGGLSGEKIDYAAHLGGALGGVSLGLFLVLIWRRDELLPPFRALAWALAAAGLCGAVAAGVQIASGYEQYDLASRLIPSGQVPQDMATAKGKSLSLVESYPSDPRSHMYRAIALMDAGDRVGAEREWKAALAESRALRLFFQPALGDFIRANLASTLKENGKEAEAREVAKPLCGSKGDIRDEMAKEGLCP